MWRIPGFSISNRDELIESSGHNNSRYVKIGQYIPGGDNKLKDVYLADLGTVATLPHPPGASSGGADGLIPPPPPPKGGGGGGIQNNSVFMALLHKLGPAKINALSGAAAGLVSGVFVCPLDVIKTKLQAQGGFHNNNNSKRYIGISGTFRQIISDDGIKGLYRGLTPIILGYLPTWTVYFTVYERTKIKLIKYETLVNHPYICNILSAVLGGGCSTLVTNPIWVVKTRLMSQGKESSWNYKSTWDAFKTIYKRDGFRTFYSGIGPAMLGLAHVAIQFPLYEELKSIFIPSERLRATINLQHQQRELYRAKHNNNKSKSNGPIIPWPLQEEAAEREDKLLLLAQQETNSTRMIGVICASLLSKICASIITYPHEVLRTRMQIYVPPPNNNQKNKYPNLLNFIINLYKSQGLLGFYSGLSANLLRVMPASAVTLLTYEIVNKNLVALSGQDIISD